MDVKYLQKTQLLTLFISFHDCNQQNNLHLAEGNRGGVIEILATAGSILIMIVTFPISIFFCFKGKHMFDYFNIFTTLFTTFLHSKVIYLRRAHIIWTFECLSKEYNIYIFTPKCLYFLTKYIVVQEYERAVIFRMGRLRSGGARGEYLFFFLSTILCERVHTESVWFHTCSKGCAKRFFNNSITFRTGCLFRTSMHW